MVTNQTVGQLPYFYDAQLRRILIQFMRIFTVFKYQTGQSATGVVQYVSVPVIYGEPDRQASQMIMGNSENTTLNVPRIAVSINALTPASLTRGGYQGNTQNLEVNERKFDPNTGHYTADQGNTYRVETLQPNPLDIQFKVDLWTSNTDQKLQLFEQIYTLFNPSLDIQTSSSPLDWTALQVVTLDSINWDDEGVDRGTDTTSDIISFLFTAKCWINPPARVTRQVLIHTIIERMGDSLENCDNLAIFSATNSSLFNIVTPDDATITVNNGQITLLGAYGDDVDQNGNPFSWVRLLDEYGGLNANISKLSLRWVSDITDNSKDIIGTISLHPTLDNVLLFDVITDTLPMPTIPAIDAMIDPHVQFPGHGLPAAATGQRYILTNEIGAVTVAWGNLLAEANDIIQYNGSAWTIVLDASTDTTLEFVQNTQSGNLLKLVSHVWVDAVNQKYENGFFNLLM